MQTGTDVVEVDFIVVEAFSPNTAIMGRPWLHSLGAFSSTLHQKVKYPYGGQVLEIVESQSMARQCLLRLFNINQRVTSRPLRKMIYSS